MGIVVVVLLGAALWVRFAPHDRDRWHVDPAEEDPGETGIRMVGRDAPRFPGHPGDVLGTLAEIAAAHPRTSRLDGDVDEGMMTFVVRSDVLGLPDYITFKATDEGTETKLSVLSRARYGWSDLEVNRARLERWLGELDRALR